MITMSELKNKSIDPDILFPLSINVTGIQVQSNADSAPNSGLQGCRMSDKVRCNNPPVVIVRLISRFAFKILVTTPFSIPRIHWNYYPKESTIYNVRIAR